MLHGTCYTKLLKKTEVMNKRSEHLCRFLLHWWSGSGLFLLWMISIHSRLNSHWAQTPSPQMFNLKMICHSFWCYQNIQSFSAATMKLWIHQHQKFSRKRFPCPSPCEDSVPRWNWGWQLTGGPSARWPHRSLLAHVEEVSARPSQTIPWASFPSRGYA